MKVWLSPFILIVILSIISACDGPNTPQIIVPTIPTPRAATPSFSPTPSPSPTLTIIPTMAPHATTPPATAARVTPTPVPTSTAAAIPTQEFTPALPNIPPSRSLADNGLGYAPFRDGQSPDVGIYSTLEEIREDLVQIKSITSRIRTYGASGVLYNIPEEASTLGISVIQGVSLGSNADMNENEINNAIRLANSGSVKSIIVGNEVLLTGILSLTELVDYIRQVKKNIPSNVAVTTAEPWSVWLANPVLADEVDFILIHIYPFWEDIPIEGAAQYVIDRYCEVKVGFPNKEVVIGETGWASGGTSQQAGIPPEVVPSEENQRRFIEEFTQLAHNHSIEYYFFSSYDEEWKWKESTGSGVMADPGLPLDRNYGGNYPGASWGIFYSDGRIKAELAPLFPSVETRTARTARIVFDARGLAAFYDMGVDSSQERRDWLNQFSEGMQLAYPAGQAWGAVFITVGEAVDPPRPWKDFSKFSTLSVQMKGEHGGELVEVGIKDALDPDNGTETKVQIELSRGWQTFDFPISEFQILSPYDSHPVDPEILYVVVEFVFTGPQPQTVYFRDVRYLP